MNRVIYQNEGIFVGPEFVHDVVYTPNEVIDGNLDRVQSITYDFNVEKESASVIGKAGSLNRYISNSPKATLTIDHAPCSFANEKLLGLDIMQTSQHKPVISGVASETDRSKDGKNIYLVTLKEGLDLKSGYTGDIQEVLTFNGCKIDTYSMNVSVGQLPSASISLTAYDANYYSSGSNFPVPILDKKNRSVLSDIPVTIPNDSNSKIVFATSDDVVTPRDISVTITNETFPAHASDFTPIKNDKIQSFEISFDLGRQPIDLVGYKIPYDSLLTYPITSNINLSFIADAEQSESLHDFIKDDARYSILAEATNQNNQKIMEYSLKNVTIDTINYEVSVGANKAVSMQLSTEIDPSSTGIGVFFSGV